MTLPTKYHLTLSGSPEDITRGQGRHGGVSIDDALGGMAQLEAFPKRLPLAARRVLARGLVHGLGQVYYRRHRALLGRFAGGKYARALEGLADALGAGPAFVYGLGAFEITAAKLSFTPGCTALALASSATESGQPLLAYNHDFPRSFHDFIRVREVTPNTGYRSLSVGYPVALGINAGVNAAGLAITVNHAWATDFDGAPAVLVSVMAREVLETCATVEQAIALFASERASNGSMITLVDASGDRAVIEVTPKRQVVRRTDGPVLHTFNRYQCAGTRAVEVPDGAKGKGPIRGLDIHGANRARQARYDALGSSQKARWSDVDIDSLLADHDNGSASCDTVCRHPDRYAETLFTVRLDPVARRMRISLGYACTPAFHELTLRDPVVQGQIAG